MASESTEPPTVLDLSVPHSYAARRLPDGRLAVVVPLLFGRARIGVGPPDVRTFEDLW